MYIYILSLIILLSYLYFFNTTVLVKSNIDENKYWVQNITDSKESSDTIANINIKINTLIKYLKNNDEKYKENEKYVKRLIEKYNPSIFSEGVYTPGFTSYGIDKKKIVLCLRQKPSEEIVGDNTLMYVILHELSHFIADGIVLTDEEHRTDKEFNTIFDFLLKAGKESGIYINTDYKKNPQAYCGINID